jgi:hypothetical protein
VDWLKQPPQGNFTNVVTAQAVVSGDPQAQQMTATYSGALAYFPVQILSQMFRLDNFLHGTLTEFGTMDTRVLFIGLHDPVWIKVYTFSGQTIEKEVTMVDIGCSLSNFLSIQAQGDDGRAYEITLAKIRHLHIPVGLVGPR